MVDCLQSDSRPVDSIFREDGSVHRDAGCLTANIPRCRLSDHAEYDIEIRHPSGHSWCITRRYREFRALRDALHSAYDLPADVTLPSRKLFNNLSRTFVCQRSRDLEAFLNRLLAHYTLPPAPLAAFIDWDRYDIHGITNFLARQLLKEGDTILSRNLLYSMKVYQLSAVNRRIISPVAPILFNEPKEDFGHVLDFLGSLEKLRLIGSIEKLHKSNVTINSLNFDMSPFKRLKYLELINVELKRMRGFECIKGTVTELIVHHSLKNLRNLMLGDLYAAGGGDWVYGETPVPTLPWNQIKMADFSNNFLHSIDQTITLLPMVEILNLSNNLLTELAPLTCLPYLRVLYLSGNQLYIGEEAGLDLPPPPPPANGLSEAQYAGDTASLEAARDSSGQPPAAEPVVLGTAACATSTSGNSELSAENRRTTAPPPLHTRLGEIHVLALANNGLRSASLVAGLNSLQHLDLSNNKIDSFAELVCLGNLPHLSSVDLSGNPVCGNPYYRRNTLDLLGLRFTLIALDGYRATRLEIEIVEIYRALKRGGVTLYSQSPDVRAPTAEQHKESTSTVSKSVQEEQPAFSSQDNHEVASCNQAAMVSGAPDSSDTSAVTGRLAEKEVPDSICQLGESKLELPETDAVHPPSPDHQSLSDGRQVATKSSSPAEQTEQYLHTRSTEVLGESVITVSTGLSPRETLPPSTLTSNASGHDSPRSSENFADTYLARPDLSPSVPAKVGESELQPGELHAQPADTLPDIDIDSQLSLHSRVPCEGQPCSTTDNLTLLLSWFRFLLSTSLLPLGEPLMASSLYEGLEDVELEKGSHRNAGGSSSSSWMIGRTNGNSTSPLRSSTGIGRLVASATGSSGASSESTTSLKLMQSHMAARRAQGRRGNFEGSRSSVAPVVDLQRRSGEGTYRFNQMTGKMERVPYTSRSGSSSSAGTGLLLGEPSLPLGVADEYNPLVPNDYEELARQRREKRKADERALAAARATEYNSTGGNAPSGAAASSGMCRRPVLSDASSDSETEEDDNRRRRRGGGGGGGRRSGHHHHHHSSRGSGPVGGAAIAPPSSLLEDVVVTPDTSSLASGTGAQLNDPTKPEIDDAEVKAIGDKFGINAVAAKMMARMGHRDGQGLGREGQGMSSALVVEKTSRRGGKIIHERDRQRAANAAVQQIDPASTDGSQNSALPLAPAHATNVVLLRNMCGPGEVDDDLEPETAEECAKYGKVVTCMIFELPDAAEDEAVRIFVEFEEEQAAVRAVCDLNGRFFGGRVVKAGFYDAEKFRNLELTDAPMQG
ncbi:hypothetical protein SprV_0401691300 [Sparganum proliferum]